MHPYAHCNLCLNANRNLDIGITCGLTNEKPTFENTCPKIKFNNISKEYTAQILNDIDVLKGTKKSVHFKFYVFIAIGFLVMFWGNSLLKHTIEIESIYHFKLTLLIYALGVLILKEGYGNLSNYRRKLKKMEFEIAEIKEVIQKYKIDLETFIRKE